MGHARSVKRLRAATLAAIGALLQTSSAGPTLAADRAWWERPEMGQCFPKAEDFIRKVFGEEGLSDENITFGSAAAPLDPKAVWVEDETPTTNIDRFLLEPKGGSLCLTLYAPLAATMTVTRAGSTLIVVTRSQAAPGYPEQRLRYERRAGDTTFLPRRCEAVWHGKRERKSTFDCRKLYE